MRSKKTITIPIFADTLITMYRNYKEFQKVAKIDIPEEDADGITQGTRVWIRDRASSEINTVVHESVHLVRAILGHCSVTTNDEELHAYLTGYICEQLWRFYNNAK